MGDVAILMSPHHRAPEMAGIKQPLLSNQDSRSTYAAHKVTVIVDMLGCIVRITTIVQ